MPSNLFKTYFINTLFILIPINNIIGNLALNANVVLLIISVIFFYGFSVFKFKFLIVDKLIIFFFIYILAIGFFNNIYGYYFEKNIDDFKIVIKSLAYLRYLFLYLIIRFLINENIINFKIFFISVTVIISLLCLDLIFQFYFGVDFLGNKAIHPRRMSGPFGDELIAGAFLQRFAIFSIFLIPVFYKGFLIKNSNLIFAVLFSLLIFSLIIAGNRIPFILFLLTIFTILILEKQARKYILPFLFLVTSIFLISFNQSKSVNYHYGNIFYKAKQFIQFSQSEISIKDVEKIKNYQQEYVVNIGDKKFQLTNTYMKEFNTGYKTWLVNKYFGGGIKSFGINCSKAGLKNCGPHPHNYYLEILAILGLVGLLMVLIIFSLIFYSNFIKRYFFKSNLSNNYLITPFVFVFLAEIFPIKTTGSFFSTNSATYLFLIMAVVVGLSNKKI